MRGWACTLTLAFLASLLASPVQAWECRDDDCLPGMPNGPPGPDLCPEERVCVPEAPIDPSEDREVVDDNLRRVEEVDPFGYPVPVALPSATPQPTIPNSPDVPPAEVPGIPALPGAPPTLPTPTPGRGPDPPERPGETGERPLAPVENGPAAPVVESARSTLEVVACGVDALRSGPLLGLPVGPDEVAQLLPSSDPCVRTENAPESPSSPEFVDAATDGPIVRVGQPRIPMEGILGGLLVLALAAILFTRLTRRGITDHPRRQAILDLVRAEPGLEIRVIADRIGMPWSKAKYHLMTLDRAGLVLVRTLQGRSAVFLTGALDPKRQEGAALLRRPTFGKVHATIKTRPGIDQATLAEVVGVRQPRVSKALARLTAAGVVVARRDGGRLRYFLDGNGSDGPTASGTPDGYSVG